MKIGYARVSTDKQNLDLQRDALRADGCEQVYEDVVSGAKSKRTHLTHLMKALRSGDTVVVWRLDRLGRSLSDLINLIKEIESRGAAIKSLKENIDTSTSAGKLIFHVFASLAEFERNIIQERTSAGLRAARARGRVGGRPPAMSAEDVLVAQSLYDSRSMSILEICKKLKISAPTLYKYIKTDDKKARAAEKKPSVATVNTPEPTTLNTKASEPRLVTQKVEVSPIKDGMCQLQTTTGRRCRLKPTSTADVYLRDIDQIITFPVCTLHGKNDNKVIHSSVLHELSLPWWRKKR